ncbi:MAG: NADH-quinone oxidoreductase subunit J [Chloroflexota bacterium]|nr:NADH-quinone oxidoreductase subunit J [Chloroflexota bacterium]
MALPQTVPIIGWAWDDLIFLLLAGMMLGAALMVVLGRDIIRAGLFLMLSFGALAGIYVLLGAPIVAAAQVLIYIGAVGVLILFAIMLTQTKAGPAKLVFHHQAWAGGLAAIVLAVLLIVVVIATEWPDVSAAPAEAATETVARLLFTDFVFAFEIVGVLLLAAVIGGIFLAKREDSADPGERDADQAPTLARLTPRDGAGRSVGAAESRGAEGSRGTGESGGAPPHDAPGAGRATIVTGDEP